MHGIGIVSQQPAIRAFEAHLVWPQHGASEIEKQSYAKNHDNDRYQPAGGALQCDVAETRSGQCGDGEIERIGIVGDAGIAQMRVS